MREGADHTPHLWLNWPDQPKDFKHCKTPSAILYDNGEVRAWGWTADAYYQQLGHAERASDRYKLVKEPKQLLLKQFKGGKLPAGLSAVQVAADYLQKLREFIIRQLRAELGEVSYDTLCAPHTSTSVVNDLHSLDVYSPGSALCIAQK